MTPADPAVSPSRPRFLPSLGDGRAEIAAEAANERPYGPSAVPVAPAKRMVPALARQPGGAADPGSEPASVVNPSGWTPSSAIEAGPAGGGSAGAAPSGAPYTAMSETREPTEIGPWTTAPLARSKR